MLNLISIQNVHKKFGNNHVLKGVNLEINTGMTTAIVGPSGVGKSVLLKLIMGIYKPTSGKILIDGIDITKINSEEQKNELRKRLGVLFQSAALFDSLSIFDNIAFPLRERLRLKELEVYERVNEIMVELSLTKFSDKYPADVSIGVRKRAGMARALITEPKVILFDEPNTGLDPLVGQEVYDLIKECQTAWNFAGVVISHELPEVFQVSDRVAMILGGEIVIEGTPEDIQNSKIESVNQFLHGRTYGPIEINW